MKANIRLGRVWNIPIGINNSWFLIFALATWSLAMGIFPLAIPGLATPVYWLLGAITSVLFFGSVLAHELGHAYLARRNDVPVRAITLFFFGGVAEITREPRTAGAEFRIAIAGPVVSVGLAALFGLLALLAQGIPVVAGPAQWLARINLILALFNLLPGFPLDGGRVLRAAIWQFTGSQMRATKLAATAGQIVAFGFFGFGAISALTGNLLNGLWLVFLGFFLNSAAAGSKRQVDVQQALRGITAGELMNRSVLRVPSWVTVGDLINPATLSQGHRAFLVEDFGQLQGMLTLRDLSQTPRGKWSRLKVEQVMVPWEQLLTVQADTEMTTVIQLMSERSISELPVTDVAGSDVLGMLSWQQIANYLRLQAELSAGSKPKQAASTVTGEA